ncbi:MAG: Trk system potassium transporter TrkA [Bacteroidales bacterium]|nr:Trk system potassium transporter TrkA [Bacteroidales bacterium]
MKIVIVGAGEVGSHLAKMLRNASNDVTVIDNDNERLQRVTSIADVGAINGSPTAIDVLKSADVASANLFIAVYPRAMQHVNIVSALIAKKLGAEKVVARINDEGYLDPENKLMFKEMGIELMFYPEKVAADEIVENLRHASAAESMDFAHGKLQVALFRIDEESPMMDVKIGEFATMMQQEQVDFRVIAINRAEETLIPRFDTKFQYHDLVFIITKREGIPLLMKYFGLSRINVDKVMIFGGGVIAEMLARSLEHVVSDIKILEINKERCFELAEKLDENVQIVNGDGRNSDFLMDEGIKDYDAFVALTDSDETNILSCVAARKFGVERTIAEVENIEYIHLAEDLGVDTVINKKLITAGRIFKFTLSGKARLVKYISGTSAEILEYTVASSSKITKGALKDLDFPKNAIIGGVIRGNDSFIAVGDTVIEPYDRVVVFAKSEAVKEVDRFFK